MRPTLVAVAALAIVCACGAYTGGITTTNDGGPPIGGGLLDGGDAGPRDGGGDAGPTSDAGCTPLTLGNAGILDGCISSLPTVGSGSVSVNPATCTVMITMTTGTSQCTGPVHGPRDAFDGGCGGYTQCSSSSLPGNIICVVGTTGSCTISVCDGGC
jgi:hypothetical protein